jgi:hypothetical protein
MFFCGVAPSCPNPVPHFLAKAIVYDGTAVLLILKYRLTAALLMYLRFKIILPSFVHVPGSSARQGVCLKLYP